MDIHNMKIILLIFHFCSEIQAMTTFVASNSLTSQSREDRNVYNYRPQPDFNGINHKMSFDDKYDQDVLEMWRRIEEEEAEYDEEEIILDEDTGFQQQPSPPPTTTTAKTTTTSTTIKPTTVRPKQQIKPRIPTPAPTKRVQTQPPKVSPVVVNNQNSDEIEESVEDLEEYDYEEEVENKQWARPNPFQPSTTRPSKTEPKFESTLTEPEYPLPVLPPIGPPQEAWNYVTLHAIRSAHDPNGIAVAGGDNVTTMWSISPLGGYVMTEEKIGLNGGRRKSKNRQESGKTADQKLGEITTLNQIPTETTVAPPVNTNSTTTTTAAPSNSTEIVNISSTASPAKDNEKKKDDVDKISQDTSIGQEKPGINTSPSIETTAATTTATTTTPPDVEEPIEIEYLDDTQYTDYY